MIDDGVEHGDSSARPSGQPAPGIGMDEAARASNRRRIIISSLLAPPAVMTLRARSVRGAPTTASCKASVTAASTHCK